MILGFFGSNERALALAIEAGEGVGQSPCEDVYVRVPVQPHLFLFVLDVL